jgi:hypothetical protein
MKPIYLDIHIHTSEDPNNLNIDYDVDTLLRKVGEVCKQSDFMISLTDHNTINKAAYLKIIEKTPNILLGTELHIKNYEDRAPYHCHIIFDVEKIEAKVIDDINAILDRLYPNKVITPDSDGVPSIDKILREFDKYEFVLLPHGGQSHSTFDKSFPKNSDIKFDTMLERYIYYNQFDGFTARSNEGLDSTLAYFKRLGINEFVNLITCTDNYNPVKYPNAKVDGASAFIPTWMLARPTFNGLRLSLSESSRLVYNVERPNDWAEYIEKVKIKNEKVDIDVRLTAGLNVVIGGSSSGKTLFIDSIYRKLCDCLDESDYRAFDINDIEIANPSGNKPHYISQNYIIKVIDPKNSEFKINDIDIIRSVFPDDRDIDRTVNAGLVKLKQDLYKLIHCVENIEILRTKLSHFQLFTRLILNETVKENIIEKLLPQQNLIDLMDYDKLLFEQHIESLENIKKLLKTNKFAINTTDEIDLVMQRLMDIYNKSCYEKKVRNIISEYKQDIDNHLRSENMEQQTKKKMFDDTLSSIVSYSSNLNEFYHILSSISTYSIKYKTQIIKLMGHSLFVENNFELNKEKFVEISNKFLESDYRIKEFSQIKPNTFFKSRFIRTRPNVTDYNDFALKIYNEFEKLNKKVYKIISSEQKDFYNLSAGWKTAVILDLILGYDGDMAPIIIDQPEDNLATGYINGGLIKAIKETKSKKQVILVSHNATIPMLGDAQNIILCQTKDDKIYIRSAGLEEKLDGKDMLDYIAEITDGGKPSIKKRVKKYNLKQYKE